MEKTKRKKETYVCVSRREVLPAEDFQEVQDFGSSGIWTADKVVGNLLDDRVGEALANFYETVSPTPPD